MTKKAVWGWCAVGAIVGLSYALVESKKNADAFDRAMRAPQPMYIHLPEPPPEPVKIDVTIRRDDGRIPQLSR
jgi:hypothetical protein